MRSSVLAVTVGAMQLLAQTTLAQTSGQPGQPPLAAHSSPLRAIGGVFPDVRHAAPLSHMEELALQPMDHFKECNNVCPEMVVVPTGSFVMGSSESELGSIADEPPQQNLTIANSFAVGRVAVTFREWDTCVAAGGCRYRPSDQGWGREDRPVLNILSDDAKEYVWWLSKITGKPYRLLSEAEYEYVARAGTTTAFWSGDSFEAAQANCNALNDSFGPFVYCQSMGSVPGPLATSIAGSRTVGMPVMMEHLPTVPLGWPAIAMDAYFAAVATVADHKHFVPRHASGPVPPTASFT